MMDESPGAEIPRTSHDQGKPAEDAGGSPDVSTVMGVTGEALVVEPGDRLLIMTGMVFREREQLADKIRRALPGVGVEVVRVPEGGPTLLYRPSRDRARTDVAPPRCLPDPSRISGWRCAPHLAGQVHGHAWRVKEATGAFTPVCVWCLHPAADLVSCACACHDSADEQAAESILRTVEQAKVAAARGAHLHPTDSSTLTQSELGHGVTSRSTFAQSVLGHLTGMPTVEVPERVDELPPLDDDAHDQAADQ